MTTSCPSDVLCVDSIDPRLPLFFKLDITKAFDSVRWEYLLTLMSKLGFPKNGETGWLPFYHHHLPASCSTESPLHLSSTSRIAPRRPSFTPAICHCYRPTTKNSWPCDGRGTLSKNQGENTVIRTSMYVDNTAIFVKPYKRDATTLAEILAKFRDVTGLKTNVEKSSVIPIRCQGVNL